jgi:hypothetical protein
MTGSLSAVMPITRPHRIELMVLIGFSERLRRRRSINDIPRAVREELQTNSIE